MDSITVFAGCLFAFAALAFWLHYLFVERGSILDPISASWAGYMAFIAVAMIAVGVYYPNRNTLPVASVGIFYVLLGTLTFVAGLYSGKAWKFAGRLPTPHPEITGPTMWLMWAVCVVVSLAAFSLKMITGQAAFVIADAFVTGSIGAATILSVLGVFRPQNNPFGRLLMATTFVGLTYLVLQVYWSRRPLLGVAIVAIGYLYRYRMARWPASTKALALLGVAVGMGVMLLFTTASRGQRFYGRKVAAEATFSSATFRRFVGGLDINYLAYEFALQKFPQERGFLLGSGYTTAFLFFIPRGIWPDKPISTGNLVSRMWYGTNYLKNNLGLPPFGELYANFAIVGVVVGCYLAGRLVRIVNSYLLLNGGNLTLWLAWLIILPDWAAEWRGDFTSMTVQGLLRIAVFLGLAWVAGIVLGHTRRAQAAPARSPPGTRVAQPYPARWPPAQPQIATFGRYRR